MGFRMMMVLAMGLLLLQMVCGQYSHDNYRYDHDSAQPSMRCGEIINSLERKNGTIESPNYPRAYPSDLTCRFTFQGVGRERIQLRFVHMDLFYTGDAENPATCNKFIDSVTVYITINGKAEELAVYCGKKLPPMLMSNSHTMTVEFRSFRSSSIVTGFRANFQFVTNFGITTGKQDTRGTCIFNYQSHIARDGHIMSPNYPGLYPRNTECHYLFYGQGSERVHITFLYFEVDGIAPRCEEHTNSDYVSFSNFAETEDRKLYRMCGQAPISKHKIQSDGAFFRVTFKSNHLYDGHGFQAFYQFHGGAGHTARPDTQNNGPHSGGSNSNSNNHDNYNNYNNNHNNGGGVASTNGGGRVAAASLLMLLLVAVVGAGVGAWSLGTLQGGGDSTAFTCSFSRIHRQRLAS